MSTNNKPLWAKMLAAYVDVSGSFTDHLGNERLPGPDREEMAAVLRVIADEVAPDGEPDRVDQYAFRDKSYDTIRWCERQRIRQRILAEAEQAEEAS